MESARLSIKFSPISEPSYEVPRNEQIERWNEIMSNRRLQTPLTQSQYNIVGRMIYLWNLGSPLTEDFLEMYSTHYTNGIFDASGLFNNSFDFFDANYQNSDVINSYFENYSILWTEFMSSGRYTEAAKVYEEFALNIVWRWERQNSGKLLHKGTPYYFLGVSKITMGDLDDGFLLMHQALEEDKRTFGNQQPPTPAYSFVTLDDSNQSQFFIVRVKQTSNYLDQRLAEYRRLGRGSLTLPVFKTKFLKKAQLEEPIFYFVVLLHRLLSFSVLESRIKNNILGSLHETSLLFSLTLVIDATLRNKDTNTKHKYFREFLAYLAQNCTPPLTFTDADFRKLSRDFEQNFSQILRELLESRYRCQSGGALSPIEEDIALAHGFRNFGAHKIEYQAEIINNVDSILQRLFNVLFFAVEHLFP